MYPLVDITIGIMELKKMATSKIKNVNTGEMSDSTKRKNPYSPHDLPDHLLDVDGDSGLFSKNLLNLSVVNTRFI
jgi:hypothetical protein